MPHTLAQSWLRAKLCKAVQRILRTAVTTTLARASSNLPNPILTISCTAGLFVGHFECNFLGHFSYIFLKTIYKKTVF